MDLDEFRDVLRLGRLEWRKHTLVRLAERDIPQRVIIEVIMKGEIIEDYSQDIPFHSCLVLGWIKDKPYHVVASLDESSGIGYIITAYEPSLDKFGPDFKTRR